MKILMWLALFSVSGGVFAAGAPVNVIHPEAAVTQYDYSMKLQIAKVIRISDIPNVCEVVPAQMTYEDHQGQQHTIEYRVMGTGCLQG